MAALGDDFGGIARRVDGFAGCGDGTGGFDGDGDFQVLAGADAAEHAARVVGSEALRRQRVAVHAAALGDAGETGTDLHAFDGVQAHHGVGDVGVELVKQRLAQAHGHAGGGDADTRAAGILGVAQGIHVVFQCRHIGHRGEKRVVGYVVPALERHHQVAHLGHAAAKHHAVLLCQPFFGHRACSHGGRGQAGGRTAAATRVADAELVPVGVVGMAGAKALRNGAVILAALVGIADQQGDGGAGGFTLVHATQDFDRVGLVALGDVAAGAGAAAVQVGLDIGLAQSHAGGAAVDHAANGRAVGFTKVGDCE